jgi:predicted O-methyltransferase YrrM
MARLATADGRFVGWARLPHLVPSFCQAVVRRLTGRVPRLPWIPFAARAALEAVLRPDFIVWEVGAGYSTLWLSPRVARLTSIEASEEWYRRLAGIIERERIRNVDLRHLWQRERMSDFSALGDESLDLLFIDGGPRGECLENGFRKVKRGGWVYLDNWDTKAFWGPAADFPQRHAARIAEARSFVDYVPAQVGVYEGLLLRKA